MSKRKAMTDAEAVMPFRRTAAPRPGIRTVEQLRTGSIGVHRKPYPPLSLLGLPRELRDLIYEHIPYEVVCRPNTQQKIAIDPMTPEYYTNEPPTPPKYGGIAIDNNGVNELLTYRPPGQQRQPFMIQKTCRQTKAEYTELWKRSPRRDNLRFMVHNYDFDHVIRVINAFRPTNVIIMLLTDENYSNLPVWRTVLRWIMECTTPNRNELKTAEINSHKFTLTYEQALNYDNKESLAKARQICLSLQKGFMAIQKIQVWPYRYTPPDHNTLEFLQKHNESIISWMDRHDGTADIIAKYELAAARAYVDNAKIYEAGLQKYGLVNESAFLGRKRDAEDMEAGGRADPLDAEMRIMMRRLGRWKRDLEDMEAGGRADALDAQFQIMMSRLVRWKLD